MLYVFNGGSVVFTSDELSQQITGAMSTGTRRIKKIELKDNNSTVISSSNFTYSAWEENRYYFLDTLVIDGKPYKFDYYKRNALPTRNQALSTDYWGYYNGASGSAKGAPNPASRWDSYFNSIADYVVRLPSLENTKLGVLTSITYPTGGIENYEYELNTYSKKGIQKPTGSGFMNVSGGPNFGGGLRVSKITLGDMVRKYKYVNSFDPNNPDNQGAESSGILYKSPGIPYYGSSVVNVLSVDGEPPIVYGKVIESLADKSYTEYTMQSPLDVSDGDAYASDTYYSVGINTGASSHIQRVGFVGGLGKSSSRSLERGQLISKKVYDGANTLKKHVAYTYATDPDKLSQNVAVASIVTSTILPVSQLAYELGYQFLSVLNTYEVYTYPVYLEKEIETSYESGQSMVTTTEYKYNPQKLRSEISFTSSTGENVKTKIRYPADLNMGIYPSMVAKKMLNFPIEQVQLKNTSITASNLTTYKTQVNTNGNVTYYLADKKYTLDLPLQLSESLFTYFNGTTRDTRYNSIPDISYDTYSLYGNVRQTTERNGIVTSYIWDTLDKYMLASVIGSNYSSINTQDNNKAASYSSSALYSSLNSLAPSALIKSYSYKPLVGIESATDPSGKLTWYNYDSFGRLSNIREGNAQGNLLKSFDYNYGSTASTSSSGISRILIVGNSITKLVAQSGSDGWQSPALSAAGGWGRASSTQDKDFAHILESRFKKLNSSAKVLPLWEAPFERDYLYSPAGWLTYDFTALQNRILSGFNGDKPELIIIRLGENVSNAEVEVNNFKAGYKKLLDKISEVSAPNAKIIVTNSMWPDQPLADARILEVANERSLPFVNLSDMISNPIFLAGNDPATLAAFPNNTGDRHPGDAGMLEIADRIWGKVTNTELPSNIGGNITNVRLYTRTDCCIENIVGSLIQGSNDISNPNGWTTLVTINETPTSGWNQYAIRTTQAWRYLRFIAGPNCSGELKELEFYNGNVKLTGLIFGSATASNNNPSNFGYGVVFDGLLTDFWQGTSPGSQNYAGIDLGAGCTTFTASMLSPANNVSVTGTASTTTSGRVTTAISVTTCVPTGTTISSVEIWAATSTGGWPNRMGYAVAVPGQPGVYTLSSAEGSTNGKWPVAYLDPGTYRFYAVVNTSTGTITVPYHTITLTAPTVTGCNAPTASMLSPANNASVTGTASTTTAGRVITAISVSTCVPAGTAISSVEIWAATGTGGWPNRMGYAVAVAGQPGVYTLSAAEGSANGKWPVAYLDPGTYRFYAVVNTATGPLTTAHNTVTLTAPIGTGCPALTSSMLSPVNNASVTGTASTTTAGRVTTAISVTTCVPAGTTISSVEIWAATSTGGWPNRMGYAVAVTGQAGVYTLSAVEGTTNGKWPVAYLEPGTYRFYAVVNTNTGTQTTPFNTITLTAPTGTGCPALTASMLSPANNASVEGTASTTTVGRVTTAISVSACAPAGTTISSVEIWATTSTGGFPNRMGYAVADAAQPGVYTLSAMEGSTNGKWPVAYLDPGVYRFYAVVNTATGSLNTGYNTITLTAPTGTGCTAPTASMLSPINNASVVGTASTTTMGRVTTAISVSACVPAGTTISNVEIWASTNTGSFPNRMGYAVPDASQPGVYTLSASEGTTNGKWPVAYLDPGVYRFYAVVNTNTGSINTGYNTITLTAPTGTGCTALTASMLSPVNNASVMGTASATTAGRVTTAISINTCVPAGTTINSVEIWAATNTGGFPNRMGYAIAETSRPGVYTLSAAEGSTNGKWPIAYLDPGIYRFYAVVNANTGTQTTPFNTITLTAPTGTGCPAFTASMLSPINNASVLGTASTTTAGRVTTAISVTTCVPAGTTISSVEIWAATSTGGFPNRMGYAVTVPGQPGVYTLSAAEGTTNGKWPVAYLDPGIYRFYAVVNTNTGTQTTPFNTITLTAP
jgi:cyanate lyase